MNTKEELIEKIKKFIDNPVAESDNGGWPDIKTKDTLELYSILRDIIDYHFPRDCDGDTPIEFNIINRKKYERSHFFKVPYPHNDIEKCLEVCVTNASLAINRLQNIISMKKYREEEKEIEI